MGLQLRNQFIVIISLINLIQTNHILVSSTSDYFLVIIIRKRVDTQIEIHCKHISVLKEVPKRDFIIQSSKSHNLQVSQLVNINNFSFIVPIYVFNIDEGGDCICIGRCSC